EFAGRVAAGVELAAFHGLAVVAERPAHRWKGEVGPRDLLPAEEADLGALGAGCDVGRGEVGAVDHLYLGKPRDGVDGEHAIELDLGAGLFPRLAQGAVGRGLVQLEVAGGQRPVSAPRMDGAAAEEDAVLPAADRADDDLGVLVGDEAAVAADQPLAVVPRGHPADEGWLRRSGMGHALEWRRAGLETIRAPPR